MNGKERLKKYAVRLAILGLVTLVTEVIDAKLRGAGMAVIVNPGMALGVQVPGLVWLRLLWLIPLLWLYLSYGNIGWMLIMAGGIVNLVSGINGGGVGDYWTIPYTQLHNNLPDWLIFAGFLGIIWKEARQRQKLK